MTGRGFMIGLLLINAVLMIGFALAESWSYSALAVLATVFVNLACFFVIAADLRIF